MVMLVTNDEGLVRSAYRLKAICKRLYRETRWRKDHRQNPQFERLHQLLLSYVAGLQQKLIRPLPDNFRSWSNNDHSFNLTHAQQALGDN